MQEGRHHSHHGCGSAPRGPEMFYGYCHDTNRMRMMDYSDYVTNMQSGYSNLYNNPSSAMQPVIDALSSMTRGSTSSGRQPHHKHEHDCGCHGHGHGHDCSCSCCIRCADVVEYARCSEVRRIPITFDNDTRRERDVTLQLGNFATESGQDAGWQASVSPTQFKLPPCGETTVLVTVTVNCARQGDPTVPSTGAVPSPNVPPGTGTVDSCKVAYATLRAEGCLIRPLVIAVAVLPEQCGAHHAGCGCGCCN